MGSHARERGMGGKKLVSVFSDVRGKKKGPRANREEEKSEREG